MTYTAPALYDALTPETAARALAPLGLQVAAVAVALTRRDEKWLAWLPDGRQALFAATPGGLAALRTERRVLRTVEGFVTLPGGGSFGRPRPEPAALLALLVDGALALVERAVAPAHRRRAPAA